MGDLRSRWLQRLAVRKKLMARARARMQHRNDQVAYAKRVLARHPVHPGRVKGIDVSNNQGTVNFRRVREAGYVFAIVKATEGDGYVDPYFHNNVVAARAAGLKVGAYHFLRPRPARKGAAEADDFVRALKAAKIGKGDIRPVVDIEVSALSNADTVRYTREFVDAVAKATGVRPILYTYPAFNTWPTTLGCALWIAHYNVKQPTIPAAWTRYAMWQFTSTASVPGVNGHCDVSVCPDLSAVLA